MKKSIYTANWDVYYERNESKAKQQYLDNIKPVILKYSPSLTNILDFACGRGRIINSFLNDQDIDFDNIIGVDINKSAISYCQNRFKDSRSSFFNTDSIGIKPIKSDSISFLYSWDAMVHFSISDIEKYSPEFYRVMKSGSIGMIHHSNYDQVDPMCSEQWNENPHCRAKVSSSNVCKILKKLRFNVLESKIIDWGGFDKIDAITIFSK